MSSVPWGQHGAPRGPATHVPRRLSTFNYEKGVSTPTGLQVHDHAYSANSDYVIHSTDTHRKKTRPKKKIPGLGTRSW
jgi:hypothetical protein